MKLVTFQQDKKTGIGALVGSDRILDLGPTLAEIKVATMIELIEAWPRAQGLISDALKNHEKQGRPADLIELDAVTLLAPIPRPRKNVFCVGRNYREHIVEAARMRGNPVSFPKVPEFFSKPPTTVIGPDAGIKRHAAHTEHLDYELELGVVIGRQTYDVTPEAALSSVFGYLIVNDVTARDMQVAHGQWFKGKSLDTFTPSGPWIVTADEFGSPNNKHMTLKVNEELRQNGNTSDMLFPVAEIISYLSAGTTLEASDIIATGTPSGVVLGMDPPRWLQSGDVIECEIEGLGVLRNAVID